jgi:hypothetical protein
MFSFENRLRLAIAAYTALALPLRGAARDAGIPAEIRDNCSCLSSLRSRPARVQVSACRISYDIVRQQYGGSIAVDSKVGEYSEFAIHLPRRPLPIVG